MPNVTPEGTQTPAGSDGYALVADLRKLATTIRGLVAVANPTARAALVTALSTESRPVAPSNPILVDRADAREPARLELSHDGTTFLTVAAQPDTVQLPILTGWGTYTGVGGPYSRPRIHQSGREVTLIGGMVGRTSAANLNALQEYQVAGPGSIPAGLAPAMVEPRLSGWLQNGTSVTNAQVRILPDGSVTYIPISAINLTIGATIGYLVLSDITWTVAP